MGGAAAHFNLPILNTSSVISSEARRAGRSRGEKFQHRWSEVLSLTCIR